MAAVPLARQCTGTEAGRRGFLSAAGQLAAKNNRLQGRHRLSFADADAERPVPVAGRYHHPADRWDRERRKQRADRLLSPLPPMHRQCDPYVFRCSASARLRFHNKSAGPPGACRTGENDKGLQPALPLCPAYGRAGCGGSPLAEGPRFTGVLLPLLFCAGGKARAALHRILLHLYRRISFSPPGSSGNRSQNRKRIFKCLSRAPGRF